MKLFIDSADIEEIREAKEWGMLDGVTTNPTLIKKAVEKLQKGKKSIDIVGYIKQILRVAKGKPVSLEVVGTEFAEMVHEGLHIYHLFNSFAHNVYIKIPVNPSINTAGRHEADGIRAIHTLTRQGIPVNCTLIFTPEQALLAARAGARIVSPFVGREDDYIRELNHKRFTKEEYFPVEGVKKIKKWKTDAGVVSGVDLIKECKILFAAQKIKNCQILAASIRNPRQFREAMLAGADIATLPLFVMKQLLEHPKTREGMRQFTKDIVPIYAKVAGLRTQKKITRKKQ